MGWDYLPGSRLGGSFGGDSFSIYSASSSGNGVAHWGGEGGTGGTISVDPVTGMTTESVTVWATAQSAGGYTGTDSDSNAVLEQDSAMVRSVLGLTSAGSDSVHAQATEEVLVVGAIKAVGIGAVVQLMEEAGFSAAAGRLIDYTGVIYDAATFDHEVAFQENQMLHQIENNTLNSQIPGSYP